MLRRILDRKLLVLVIVALPIFSLVVILLAIEFSFSLLPLPSLTEKHQGVQVNLFAEGLSHPTSMAFIDNDTLLVLEKDTGYIRKITNGILEKEPLLRLNIDSTAERGLLGIAVLREERRESTDVNTSLSNDHNSSGSSTSLELSSTSPPLTSSISSEKCCHYSVFISFTQKNNSTKLSKIVALDNLSEGHKDIERNNNSNSLRNVIYNYDWDGKSLTNPELLVVLPAEPGPYHNGGKLKIGPDNQLYAVIGDLTSPNSILQNHPQPVTGKDNNNDTNLPSSLISNSSIVVRVDPYSGLPPKDNPFVNHSENKSALGFGGGEVGQGMNYIYAYGIRNSFGLAFDPLTGRLWDTENGEDVFDEINLVEPGFNSGWHQIMGPSSRNPNFTDSDL
ncbi:MAG: PQQ-dependent sugar dehydrogenase, partial [Nitrososphaeraceae archaeon]